MRVIAGKFGGRRLAGLEDAGVRPTSDRVREAIFSSLASAKRLEGARVLDLYAGTGALGIEALSRGAASCVFVERSPAAAAGIKRSLSDLGLSPARDVAEVEVVIGDVFKVLSRTERQLKGPFELIFADPPYTEAEPEKLLEILTASETAAPGSMLVLETSRRTPPPERTSSERLSAKVSRAKSYGDTLVSYLEFFAE